MPRLLGKTRFVIIFPIIGLAIAACVLFILGGLGLLRLLANVVLQSFGVRTTTMLEPGQGAMIFSIVEFVHTFLVGTVLYITAVGLYQLFIGEIPFPGWLKIDSVEELETDLIGVTVVVMAVNFMGGRVRRRAAEPAAIWRCHRPADRRAGPVRAPARLVAQVEPQYGRRRQEAADGR